MEELVVIVLMGTLTILTGTILIAVAMWRRMRIKEMFHRERMAMIERGLVPPPERDPAGFVASMRLDQPEASAGGTRARMLSGGIVIIAFGLGLMMIIGVAGEAPQSAVGIGGAIAIIGLAFVVIALVQGGPSGAALAPPLPPPVPRPTPQDRDS